jgi:serine protease Do
MTLWRDGRSHAVHAIVEELPLDDEPEAPAAPKAPGEIGARFIDISASIAQQLELPGGIDGAVVYSVSMDSAADRAGLAPGDVVQRVNRQPVRTAAEAARALADVAAGSSVFLLVWRTGDELLLQMRDE